MFVRYSPEDGTPQTWEFDPGRVRSKEAEQIEKRAGESWDSWLASVQGGSMRARRTLLWHLLRRDHPTLRWEDVPDFYASEFVVEHAVAELAVMLDRLAKIDVPDDQRQTIRVALDLAMTEAIAREEGSEPEGKAPSASDAPATP